jgi:hypothetical protein
MDNISPSESFHSRNPASRRALCENGGDLISPCSQTSGLALIFIFEYMSDLT